MLQVEDVMGLGRFARPEFIQDLLPVYVVAADQDGAFDIDIDLAELVRRFIGLTGGGRCPSKPAGDWRRVIR